MVRARWSAAAGILFLFLALVSLPLPASAAEEAQPMQDFGACVAGGGDARVLLLLDTSASLRTTDPQTHRIDAARHLTDRLGEFATDSGTSLEVSVAGFADKFDLALPWTSLAGEGRQRVAASVDDFAEKDQGWETDYWQALQGARGYLMDGGDKDTCRALVWLTDGMYDLDHRDTSDEVDAYGLEKPYLPGIELTDAEAATEAERAGGQDLCRPGGVADAIRADGVTTLAIGLNGADTTTDFDLMEGVATQTKVAGKPCGQRDAKGQGHFVSAQDVGDLFFAFDALSDPENPFTESVTPLCQGDVCPEGSHVFVTDRSIASVSVLGGADVSGYEAVLVTPAGRQFRLPAGGEMDEQTSGFRIEGRWRTDTVFSMTLTRGEAATWEGAWSVVFVDPAQTGRGEARTHIRLVSDLVPSWGAEDELVAGATGSLDLGVALTDGTRLQPGDLAGDATLDVFLDREGGERVVLAQGLTLADLQSPVTADLSDEDPGAAQLLLEMNLTTAPVAGGAGTELPARVVSYPASIQAPGEYPRLAETLEFGRGDSTDTVTATLGWEGEGCVWLAGSTIDVLPSGVTGAQLAAEQSDAESCATDELVVSLTPGDTGAGLLSGQALVGVLPVQGPGEALEIPVTIRYEMERPADVVERLWLFVLVLVLGIAFPLAILALIKKRGAVFAGEGVVVAVVRGPVGSGSSFLDAAVVKRSEQQIIALTPRQATLQVSDRVRLDARAHAFNLIKPPDVQVTGGHGFTSRGDSLPLALQNSWVAMLNSNDPGSGDVEVVFLLPPSGAGVEELLADARTRVPEETTRLRQRSGWLAQPKTAQDEWDSPARTTETTNTTVEDDGW